LLLINPPPKHDEQHVNYVPQHEKQGFPQLNRSVCHKHPDGGYGDDVKAHISKEGPSCHLEGGDEGNGADNDSVDENPRTKNGTQGELGRFLGNGGKRAEEIRSSVPEGKEGHPSNVLGELEKEKKQYVR